MTTAWRTAAAITLMWATALAALPAHGAHPLVTDDAGTAGKGRVQIELNGEHGSDSEDEVRERTVEFDPVVTYGIVDTIDVVVSAPYQRIRTKGEGETVTEEGLTDVGIEVKWRFYEKDGLSLAVKPGISLPAGDRKRGLGTGRTGYSLFLIGSHELEPWAFHANLGYVGDENRNDERRDLWHASLASEVEFIKDLSFVANVGVETNPDKASNTAPAFVLGGFIYTIAEDFSIDAGYKHGLTTPETDSTALFGVTFTF